MCVYVFKCVYMFFFFFNKAKRREKCGAKVKNLTVSIAARIMIKMV